MEAQELTHQIVIVLSLVGFTLWSLMGKPGEAEEFFGGDQ